MNESVIKVKVINQCVTVKEHILVLVLLVLDYVVHLPDKNCSAVFAYSLLHG